MPTSLYLGWRFEEIPRREGCGKKIGGEIFDFDHIWVHTHTHTHTQEEDERGRRLFGQVCSSPRSAAACELNLLGFCTKIRVIKAN